jgi:hypothetical protein
VRLLAEERAPEMGIADIKIVHMMPGRVRVKIARLKGNPILAHEIQDRLSAVQEIRRVEVNLITGSVLVVYDAVAMASPDSLLSLAASFAALFPEFDPRALQAWYTPSSNGCHTASSAKLSLAHCLSAGFGALNTSVGKAAGGLDIKILLPLGLFLLGLRGLLVAEKVTFPAWYDLLWFAFGTFFALNPQVIAGRR